MRLYQAVSCVSFDIDSANVSGRLVRFTIQTCSRTNSPSISGYADSPDDLHTVQYALVALASLRYWLANIPDSLCTISQSVLSSSGSSSAPKRLWDSLKDEGKTIATYIDRLDDDDESVSLTRRQVKAQGLKNRGTSPAKRRRIEIDLR